MSAAAVPRVLALAILAGGAATSARARSQARARVLGRGPPRRAPADLVAGAVRACAVVGRLLRQGARRAPDPEADASVGVVAVLALGSAVVAGPLVGLAVVALGAARSVHRRRAARRRHVDAVLDELPEIVDLFRVCFGAGLNVRLAVREVAAHAEGILAERLRAVAARAADGERLASLLAAHASLAPDASGSDDDAVRAALRPLLQALVASERDGAPIDASLDRAADEARDRRRRRQEERARRVPVQLLFPLVFCTLPALLVLTVVPTLVRSFPSLTP